MRRNGDVHVQWDAPEFTDEKVDLYRRYLEGRHPDGPMAEDASAGSLWSFLYESPARTIEATYRVGGRLIGVGTCDATPIALSTVYFYFDPAESRRSLGLFSSLMEIQYARQHELRYYYLGYWVPGCRKMEYKAALGDHQVLVAGEWRGQDRQVSVPC